MSGVRRRGTDRIMGGTLGRLLAGLARLLPGATTLRPWLHRRRGMRIGHGVFIGQDVLLETAYPKLISIGNGVTINARAMITAHWRGATADKDETVRVEDDVFIGPGAIVLANVTIGRGSVVTAGSVVTRTVPPMTMVQGNPAKPVARLGMPLTQRCSLREFYRQARPLNGTRA